MEMSSPEADQRVDESSPAPLVGHGRMRRHDSLDMESNKVNGHHRHQLMNAGWSVILPLAFQSLGVVYGDIGTSPLYVYASTFTDGIKHNDDILGVLSLIIYTITLITVIKYVFIVLLANDNGDGGTFALYSLICRHVKVSLTPNQEVEDADVSNYQPELPRNRLKRASRLKSLLENSPFAKYLLLFVAMLGTSMVIGDGVLTPSISVLSAVSGLQEATSSITQGQIVGISVAILVVLFCVQRFGTDKVGYTFAPIITLWFVMIGSIGLYNWIKYDPSVIRALYPKYIVDYFRRNKKDAWISLGSGVLAITGTETMFADLGHFNVRSIQISMCSLVYPALLLAYTGQAAFLTQNNDAVSNTFYASIPHRVYWPMFVVAVMAAIIASQAMISGAFSMIQQSLALGCFPRVQVIHTSTKHEGQVYIPEVNYILMLASVAVTVGFQTTTSIGNAYGTAVVFVMMITSAFLVLVMITIWKTNIFLVLMYILTICSVELIYLSSVLYKFKQGGYLPFCFAAVLMLMMFIWNDVHRRKYYYELENKVSPEEAKEIVNRETVCRVQGFAIFYSELVHGIPPIFKHYVENVHALHSVLVFLSIKALPISKIPIEERFLFRRVQPQELNIFRCVVRFGYTDAQNENDSFEGILVEKLKDYIRDHSVISSSMGREIEEVDRACRAGVVHLLGENTVIARKGANIGKKLLINFAYDFIRKNLRQIETFYDIPRARLLKVGMTYEL